MEFDITAVMTIASGVFVALVARDMLRVLLGRLFGVGSVTVDEQVSVNTFGARDGRTFPHGQ